MAAITIQCPDTVLLSLHESEDRFAKELRTAAAVKLYEVGRLSSGRAAELAGVTRVAFFAILGEYGVGLYQGTASDIEQDVQNA